MKTISGLTVICALLALCTDADAQTVEVKRLGSAACECQTAAGVRISGHTSDIQAIDACADLAFIDGLKKRLVCSYELSVTKPAVTPPPPPPITGSATLVWTEPTHRTNGVAVNPVDIIGYTIYYGTSPGSLTQSITVGPVLTATIAALPAGTWYFSIAVIALSEETPRINELSNRGNPASKVIG